MLYKLSIINDLFQCYKLPVIILNKSYSVVFKYNYNPKLENIFSNIPIIDDLKLKEFNPSILEFNYDKLNFTCICFYNCDNSPLYFIIGPYKLKNEPLSIIDNILEITETSLSQIVKLYNHILNYDSSNKSNNHYSPLIKGAINYIEKYYTETITIDQICDIYNVNKCYFCNTFKKETGITFINYLNNYKIEKSKELLKNSSLSLLDISLSVGFNNQSYYSTIFKKFNNITPLEYRANILEEDVI